MDAKVNYAEPDAGEMTKDLLHLMRGVNGQASRIFGTRVVQGPFGGMHIPLHTEWDDGNFACKILGTYEHELHGAVHHAIWRRPEIIVNVGCGEGFYAIGLARHLPDACVYAMDISDSARDLCKDYAERNQVGHINVIKGAKRPEELFIGQVFGHRLYVVDAEGDEMELLDPERCIPLRYSDIIVECHDFLRKDASSIIADRFSGTHRVELVRPRMPNYEQFEFLRMSPTVMSVLMVTEKRPMPTYWLTMWANHKETGNG